MMQNTLIAVGSACIASLLGFSVGVGGVDVVQSLIKDPEPFSMTLSDLEYRDGRFYQSFDIRGGRSHTTADWSAEIKRGDHQLCSAGGTAPYNDKSEGVSSYTPKEWAGAACPDKLQDGDVATAIWQYKGFNGLIHSIKGQIVIKDKPS